MAMASLTIRLSKGKGVANARGAVREGNDLPEAAPAVESPAGDQGNPELPVARGVYSSLVNLLSEVRVLGRKADRMPGNKVHFCIRCDFPIAVYGRLDPCQHVFCLTCAKKTPECYLCDGKVARIQRMDVLEGMYVCGAPSCLYSFLTQSEFEWHIREFHADLLNMPEASQAALPPTNQESSQQYYYQAQQASRQRQQQQQQQQLQMQQQELQSEKRQKRKPQENQQWVVPGPGEGYAFDQWNQMPLYPQQRHDEAQGQRPFNPYFDPPGYESSMHVQ